MGQNGPFCFSTKILLLLCYFSNKMESIYENLISYNYSETLFGSESKFSQGNYDSLVLKNQTALPLELLGMHCKMQMTIGNTPKRV